METLETNTLVELMPWNIPLLSYGDMLLHLRRHFARLLYRNGIIKSLKFHYADYGIITVVIIHCINYVSFDWPLAYS